MTEIVAAILGAVAGALVGPIAEIFISPYRWLARALQRRFKPKAKNLMDVDFVSDQGQNIYIKNDDPNLSPYDESYFKIQVRFRLRAKESISITDIGLRYPEVAASPIDQVIDIDGNAVRLDNRYNLQCPIALDRESVVDVKLWRKFLAKAHHAWDGDKKTVEIALEYTTQFGDGFQRAIVGGRLAPGGKIDDAWVSDDEAFQPGYAANPRASRV